MVMRCLTYFHFFLCKFVILWILADMQIKPDLIRIHFFLNLRKYLGV